MATEWQIETKVVIDFETNYYVLTYVQYVTYIYDMTICSEFFMT